MLTSEVKWFTFQFFVVYMLGFSSKPSLNKQADFIGAKNEDNCRNSSWTLVFI